MNWQEEIGRLAAENKRLQADNADLQKQNEQLSNLCGDYKTRLANKLETDKIVAEEMEELHRCNRSLIAAVDAWEKRVAAYATNLQFVEDNLSNQALKATSYQLACLVKEMKGDVKTSEVSKPLRSGDQKQDDLHECEAIKWLCKYSEAMYEGLSRKYVLIVPQVRILSISHAGVRKKVLEILDAALAAEKKGGVE
jgi:chromosome segregation ATPase